MRPAAALTLAIALLATGAALAQGKGPGRSRAERYRTGQGMGMGLAAERHGHPNPKHALRLAAELGLTDAQIAQVGKIRREMYEGAVRLGKEIVQREQALERLFDAGKADEAAVRAAAAEIAKLQGELRAVHLVAHLRTKAALTAEQIAAYARLTGRAPDPEDEAEPAEEP